MSEKPKKPYEHLGSNASVTVSRGHQDPWAQNMLKEIGKSMTREGLSYCGSAAFHVYAIPKVNVLGEVSMQYAMQISLGDTAELVAQHALIEFTKAIGVHYGHDPKTNDPRYKIENV